MPLEETFAWLRPQIPVVPWWMKHSNGKPSSNSMIFYMNLWAINLHLCRRSMDFPLRCLIHGFESWRLQGTSRGCFGSLLRGVAFVMLVMFKSFSERNSQLLSCLPFSKERNSRLTLGFSMILRFFPWFFPLWNDGPHRSRLNHHAFRSKTRSFAVWNRRNPARARGERVTCCQERVKIVK